MLISFSEITMDPTGKYVKNGPFKKKEVRRLRHHVQVYINGTPFIVILAGFESDGMSFPWWQATWDDPWHYRYVAAAVLHDYLLSVGYEKDFADWLFLGTLICYDVPSLEVGLFWAAVRTKK